MPRTLHLPFLLLFAASIVPYALPAYRDGLRQAAELRPQPMEERKAMLFAPWYAEAVELGRRVPRHGSIDFVMVTPNARDIAVLAGAVLQPRDVRFFDGWDAWRTRTRARFLHDERAANAAAGPPPAPSDVVVAVDPAATPQFRVVSPR